MSVNKSIYYQKSSQVEANSFFVFGADCNAKHKYYFIGFYVCCMSFFIFYSCSLRRFHQI